MELEPIFPIYIGKVKTKFDTNLMNIWKNYILSSEKSQLRVRGKSNSNDFLTTNQRLFNNNLLLSPLKDIILSNAKKYAFNTGIVFEDLQICSSWGYVVGESNNPNNYHSHANSLISGVFYLTPGAPIEFKSSFNQEGSFKWDDPSEESLLTNFYHKITPEEQLLIFFPSSLDHRVTENYIKDRICIAFNIIPKGYFGISYGSYIL